MQQQIQVMLDLQNDMNSRVHSDWREQGFAWYRAVWIECAEMLDHHGWKWWKKQTPDRDQVVLELIDIWHFGLSMLLLENRSAAELDSIIRAQESAERSATNFAEELEDFVTKILVSRRFDVAGFVRLMQAVNMSFAELYAAYVGKNVLNFFRQDHGYKDGSYRKQWGGREDNEHLVDITRALDATAADFKDRLYEALSERYRTLETGG
ncbi:dUTP diphosphatase [Gilvimarinus sp. F26214L]|uniref:dUTP diphosphatase n=1 Tax=Gilvimarinus sp. DZF01 TaxID=3461371 RepID=UPI0040465ED7